MRKEDEGELQWRKKALDDQFSTGTKKNEKKPKKGKQVARTRELVVLGEVTEGDLEHLVTRVIN